MKGSAIAILGGTGPEGTGLALRFALAGLDVLIGSRDEERARGVAEKLTRDLADADRAGKISGTKNVAAAGRGDLVALAFPYAGVATLASLRNELAGKVVLDVINPLVLEKGLFRLAAVDAGSAAEEIQEMLPDSWIVSAFKHQSAEELRAIKSPLRGDVLVCSNHPDALRRVLELVRMMRNLRPIDAGPLVNARSLESITALLLNLNRSHRALTSIQVLGLSSD